MDKERKATILVVDDSKANLSMLGTILLDDGYHVALASSGVEAVKCIQKEAPDLILLDVIMPNMDGFEVCRQLKANTSTKDIPVIFLTALAETSYKLKAFEAEGVDYITKPFVQEEVLARVNVHVKLKKALEKLENMSLKDELTGVYNRRFAYEILTKQIQTANRNHGHFVICFIDIDHLKRVNDSFGHSAGDELIITVATTLQNSIRSSDFLFRMGGDEFLLLFPKANLKESRDLVERFRRKISKQKVQDIPVNFSFGLSEYLPGDLSSTSDLIKLADSEMYKDKLRKK
ncbi:MAG: diguanylate cyclase response regulator [bacterium]|nr:MAG: diguanylate cyclase response regulator [bacterium]